ncbi:hypothetical protein [Azospirillum sp. B506]|uniref:hypothetical protein n=1 Tax=Azospirillum sp. B506 TaxID=137721 RepID=UPI0011DE4037|nr:hypothetical protein [Azospirillum sp. B506]
MDSILDTSAFGDTPRAGDAALPSGPDAGLLQSLKSDLRDASAPIEAAFLAVGETLSRTLDRMAAIGERFRALSVLIDNEDGVDACGRLGRVREVTDGLAANLSQTLGDLTGLDGAGTDMAALLGTLSGIIGEITALAINAKVQSVQIRSGSDDFSVFNREIDRLHRLAEQATTQAVGHLAALQVAISAARDGAADSSATTAPAWTMSGAGCRPAWTGWRPAATPRSRLHTALPAVSARSASGSRAASAISRSATSPASACPTSMRHWMCSGCWRSGPRQPCRSICDGLRSWTTVTGRICRRPSVPCKSANMRMRTATSAARWRP